MITDDRHCIDVLTQISAGDTALQAVAFKTLDDHVNHCVKGALASGMKRSPLRRLVSYSRRSTASLALARCIVINARLLLSHRRRTPAAGLHSASWTRRCASREPHGDARPLTIDLARGAAGKGKAGRCRIPQGVQWQPMTSVEGSRSAESDRRPGALAR